MYKEMYALAGVAQLATVPQSEASLFQFLVRAHAWVVGSVPGGGAYKRQLINVSHQCFSPPLSLPFPLPFGCSVWVFNLLTVSATVW